MHDLLEEASRTGLTKELGDACTGAVLFAPQGGIRWQG